MLQAFIFILFLALIFSGISRLISFIKERRAQKSTARQSQEDNLAFEEKPELSEEQISAVASAERSMRKAFLDEKMQISLYALTIIFVIGSISGLILETVWIYVSRGIIESRVGTVWGPFSPLYGFGAVFFTILSWQLRRLKASPLLVFLLSVLVGGALEQFTGWAMEELFDAQSWTYLGLPDAITQWICWRTIILWGLIGVVWRYFVMPEMLYRIGLPNTRYRIILVWVLTVYLVANLLMTGAVFIRKTYRDQGYAPQNILDLWIDQHYTDEWIEGRFQNLVIGRDLEPNR